jgi:C1A family cysteine protease
MIYGWKKDLPDHRDVKYTYSIISLPEKADLRPDMPLVYDQGQLGSCTANAGGAAFAYMHKKNQKELFMPSRLFIYYNTRMRDNTIKYDAGSTIRSTIKAMVSYGAAHENLWPYDINKFAAKPLVKAYKDGRTNLVVSYYNVPQNEVAIKTSLAQGYPVVFGFSVYDSFESNKVAENGIVPMPSKDESLIGGHAVVLVGYDNQKRVFIVRNSWGDSWGDEGYCYMPYEYILNRDLAADFWTIRLVN